MLMIPDNCWVLLAAEGSLALFHYHIIPTLSTAAYCTYWSWLHLVLVKGRQHLPTQRQTLKVTSSYMHHIIYLPRSNHAFICISSYTVLIHDITLVYLYFVCAYYCNYLVSFAQAGACLYVDIIINDLYPAVIATCSWHITPPITPLSVKGRDKLVCPPVISR